MQYMGGKSRISKDISSIINKHVSKDSTFVSLFCGTCSVESKINCENKILNDKQPYLIEMFKALQNKRDFPDIITKEDYVRVKNDKDFDVALTGFVGFGCAFGGKWFGGYAKNKVGTNYAMQAKKSLAKDMNGLKSANFLNLDYKDVKIPNNSVVYCDPPYKNTTGYGDKLKFNNDDFWDYARTISENNVVFVSEENAPEDFVCVWEKEFRRTLDVNKSNQPKKIERLFRIM